MFNFIEIIVFMITDLPHLLTMGKWKKEKDEREKYFGFGFVFYFMVIFIMLMGILIYMVKK